MVNLFLACKARRQNGIGQGSRDSDPRIIQRADVEVHG